MAGSRSRILKDAQEGRKMKTDPWKNRIEETEVKIWNPKEETCKRETKLKKQTYIESDEINKY